MTTVRIHFNSDAIGDTIAWIPYVEHFSRVRGCRVELSTYFNDFLKPLFPALSFVTDDGNSDHVIGCFGNHNALNRRRRWNQIPLQKIACDILGLEYEERRPSLDIEPIQTTKPYVCMASESTLQCKYWNYPDGWREVARALKACSLETINVSLHPPHIEGVRVLTPGPLERVAAVIKGARFFIGLPSGLSWLAWALGKKVVMISGITQEGIEFQEDCIRVSPPPQACRGCYSEREFDPSDWNWCPHHNGTLRQFECTSMITPDTVLNSIKQAGLLKSA